MHTHHAAPASEGLQAPCCAHCAPPAAETPDKPGASAGEPPARLLARYAVVSGLVSVVLMGAQALAVLPAWIPAALTALTVLYAGRPFLLSAYEALRQRQPQMDVPIALALILTTLLSVFEATRGAEHSYFDSVTMLLFVLLIGRYLDEKTRGRAKNAAAELLSLFAGTATILENDKTRTIPLRDIKPDMILLVAAGEKIGADGEVTQGASTVDASIITGETLPQPVETGAAVFGGMVNLSAPIHVRATAPSEDGLVGEVIRLMQKAEQSRAKFVRLADRAAALYVPVVLGLALTTFLFRHFILDVALADSFVTAMSVLIITCPCAMGLAVPAVQILATSRLFRQGLLVKTSDALERLAKIDTVVFDKTGTLTSGRPALVNRADVTTEELKLAASLAAQSKHPLARAVLAAHGAGPIYALDVAETPGQGLEADLDGEPVRLGSRAWCGPQSFPSDDKMELWLRLGYKPPRRLAFADTLRPDAIEVMNALRKKKLAIHLLSGDREEVVAEVAEELGLENVRAECSPVEKVAALEKLKREGRRVLMVGDGLNDAAALETADVSLSPSSALDLTQNAADMVFQGDRLAPVLTALSVARRAHRLALENIVLSVLYNVLAVPLAALGLVSPMIAAAAMSLSSIVVVLNAQRMRAA